MREKIRPYTDKGYANNVVFAPAHVDRWPPEAGADICGSGENRSEFSPFNTAKESMMEFRAHEPSDSSAIEGLFVSVFSESEGEQEGALVGNLAKALIAGTDHRDLYGFVAVDGGQVVGAVFFSRLTCGAETDVFILAPIAVRTEYQGKGIGQALITHGLRELKARGVRVVTTYGDPAFYSKVGFRPLSQDTIEAPFELSQPEGWLGQSLTDDAIEPIPGRCSCVQALADPVYW